MFWEISAICCWRLIGFYREDITVIRANKAFITTVAGALVMLIGFVGIYEQTGTFDLMAIKGTAIPKWIVVVILFGILSKSATFPLLFIVDAAYMGLCPGETKVVPACDIEALSFSTHMLPMSVMLEYLKSESGCDVTFIGIQPRFTEQGLAMCDEVKKGTERLAREFYDALK